MELGRARRSLLIETNRNNEGVNRMSGFCPHCDDFSIDSSRASRKPVKKNGPSDISVDEEVKTPVINADNSDGNADWIKKVRDGK